MTKKESVKKDIVLRLPWLAQSDLSWFYEWLGEDIVTAHKQGRKKLWLWLRTLQVAIHTPSEWLYGASGLVRCRWDDDGLVAEKYSGDKWKALETALDSKATDQASKDGWLYSAARTERCKWTDGGVLVAERLALLADGSGSMVWKPVEVVYSTDPKADMELERRESFVTDAALRLLSGMMANALYVHDTDRLYVMRRTAIKQANQMYVDLKNNFELNDIKEAEK